MYRGTFTALVTPFLADGSVDEIAFRKLVDFQFDKTRKIAPAQMADWEASADRVAKAQERREALRAQGKARAEDRNAAKVMACGGGDQQMEPVKEFRMPSDAEASRVVRERA